VSNRVFIRSPEKPENYFSERGISSLSPVYFSPIFYAVQIFFFHKASLKHDWQKYLWEL